MRRAAMGPNLPARRYGSRVIHWRSGVVREVVRSWPGVVELVVAVDRPVAGTTGLEVRALAYVDLIGEPVAGDRVLLNTTALAQGLGTGGYAMVVAIPDRLPPDPDLPGHLVKARYTPMQVSVQGADEQGSPGHETLREADDLGGMPVIVADLHSALPAVLAGLLLDRPGLPGGVRLHGRGRPPPGLLPDRGRAAGRGLARRFGDDRSGVRRGSGGGDGPHRPAGRPSSAGRGRRGGHPGTRQPGHGDPLRLLGRRGRRGGQRRVRPEWAPRGVPAGVRGGRPASAPGRQPSLAHGVRTGRPRTRGRRGARSSPGTWRPWARSWPSRRHPWVSGTGSSRCPSRACWTRWRQRPYASRRWVATSQRIPAAFLAAAAAGRHAATLVP